MVSAAAHAGKEPLGDILVIRGFPNFPRNSQPNLAEYISEWQTT